MKNIFLAGFEKKNIDNFTSDFGLKIRKNLHKPFSFLYRMILKFIYKKNVIVEKKVRLDKKKTYIFASNHSFFFDGASIIASNDRNCYALFGATEQLYFDLHTFFIWMTGLTTVKRCLRIFQFGRS